LSQRIARNTQLVLQKECGLEQVIDPAGGSWFVEVLTAELAQGAWKLFQEVEKLGGMEAALQAEFPQKAVAETAAARLKAVARRKDSIVGVNQYADPKEQPLEPRDTDVKSFYRRRTQQVASHRTSLDDEENALVLDQLARIVETSDNDLFEKCVAGVNAGATLGEITRAIRINDSPCPPITSVCLARAASQVEKLRAATDQWVAQHKELPQVFLCNMGSLREHKARADFSRGFFAMGGYEAISPEGFKSPESAAAAFVESKANVAVVCSTDDNYPALVPPLAAAIRKGKPQAVIVLAGYPEAQVEAHKQAGVDEFIHIRANALEVLIRIHSKLGIDR
jgi:methylmalonyl-CoA mutase